MFKKKFHQQMRSYNFLEVEHEIVYKSEQML